MGIRQTFLPMSFSFMLSLGASFSGNVSFCLVFSSDTSTLIILWAYRELKNSVERKDQGHGWEKEILVHRMESSPIIKCTEVHDAGVQHLNTINEISFIEITKFECLQSWKSKLSPPHFALWCFQKKHYVRCSFSRKPYPALLRKKSSPHLVSPSGAG